MLRIGIIKRKTFDKYFSAVAKSSISPTAKNRNAFMENNVAKEKERTMSSYKQGQINQLANGLEKTGYTPDEVTAMMQRYLSPFLGVIRGNLKIVEVKPSEETTINTIIRVNRSISPVYPSWVKEALHKDLELSGPCAYEISLVEKWLHPNQKSGVVKGELIYQHLKDNNMLKDQLGLADLLAIQAKGIVFFLEHYAGKAVFGWRAVVRLSDAYLYVPCLLGSGGKVILYWGWLGSDLDSGDPALRFASK